MSATFPYVTSSIVLPTDPPRHVVDAGYYDNYGVNLAANWIASHVDWIKTNTSGILVVQIRAFRNEKRLKYLNEEILVNSEPDQSGTGSILLDLLSRMGRPFAFLISAVTQGSRDWLIPFQGVAEARNSSMYFRNDEQLIVLHHMFHNLTSDSEFFRTVVFTCDSDQSGQDGQSIETLNWYMNNDELHSIRWNMGYLSTDGKVGRDRNALRTRALVDWWKARGGSIKKQLP
jgi:hypothetical protein